MIKTINIGLDVHARSSHVAILDTTTGELIEHRLSDASDEAALAYLRAELGDLEATPFG